MNLSLAKNSFPESFRHLKNFRRLLQRERNVISSDMKSINLYKCKLVNIIHEVQNRDAKNIFLSYSSFE